MIDTFDVTEMTTDNLITLKDIIETEIIKRKNERRNKLISNFKNALFALWEAGITISYDDLVEPLRLDDWDGFMFD